MTFVRVSLKNVVDRVQNFGKRPLLISGWDNTIYKYISIIQIIRIIHDTEIPPSSHDTLYILVQLKKYYIVPKIDYRHGMVQCCRVSKDGAVYVTVFFQFFI